MVLICLMEACRSSRRVSRNAPRVAPSVGLDFSKADSRVLYSFRRAPAKSVLFPESTAA